MARFFIDRPIFAWVIAISIMIVGALSITGLPVAQYPSIAPPAISIDVVYPGASAKTVEDTVVQVIEQQMNGLDHLQYISATSDSSGAANLTLTFDAGTNSDTAQVQVQNKLQLATPLLPPQVQQIGVTVKKSAKNFLLIVGFISENGSMDGFDLADYVSANVKDAVSRVPGVGDVTVFGSQYAMRVWLNPDKLNNYKMTPGDVKIALLAQNAQITAGQLGGAPSVEDQQLNVTIVAQTKLKTPEEFQNIILRVNPDGSTVFLKDVARVEIGSESYNMLSKFNGRSSTAMAIKLATGANAIDTGARIRAKIAELSEFFPEGMKDVTVLDTIPFVKISIQEVIKTLIEAIILVFIVMYVFLQNFRATLIPTLAVPVVLLGTFAVLAAFGFSINTLTMFAMVLAIGLLVDDAIVVVENVERVMEEDGLSPLEATRKSMDQITGALVGVAVVIATVFIPMAFFGGSTGIIYRQFSITIIAAMTLSVIIAIVFTPALCATMLKPIKKGHAKASQGFFGAFNRGFDRCNDGYIWAVKAMIPRWVRSLLIYAAFLGIMAFLFIRLPSGFLPDEDQGFLFTIIQLPPGATQERTSAILNQVTDYYQTNEKEAVEAALTVNGYSFAGNGQNMAMCFVKLRDWDKRGRADLKVGAVAARAMGAFSKIKDAMVIPFSPPPIMELGNATGFDFQLQDRAGLGHEKLMEARNMLLGMAGKNRILMAVRPNGQSDTTQYELDIDFKKAGAFGLSLADINETLAIAWGSSYINDFLDKGRTKKVYMQADAEYRMLPEDLNKWYVRNKNGDMVSFSSFTSTKWQQGAPRLERYNGVPSINIVGQAVPGISSGVAMDDMEAMAKNLPKGIGFEWTGTSLQERSSGAQAPALYAISLIFIFLCLAALYESWSIPLSVLLIVPLGVVGALLATYMRGLSNDVYFQVGLLTTIGLAAKNAILIVEFAKDLHHQGVELVQATIDAARMRLRPILMTSFAFMLGVLPLAISKGAGSGAQNALGTGVMGGMIAATALAIFFVPLFFILMQRLFAKKVKGEKKD